MKVKAYSKYKDSGVEWLGEVPEHWEKSRLKYLFKFVSGGTPPTEDERYWNGELPWVSPKDMKCFRVVDTEDHVTHAAVSQTSTTLVNSNTVLIVTRSGILTDSDPDEEETGKTPPPIPAPFEIKENVIYDPPHVSPRIRAQDGVLLACHQPLQDLEEKDCLEIIIKHEAHDDIRRRLDQYGVFDRQLFPDLDGIAKWLKYRVFEIQGTI